MITNKILAYLVISIFVVSCSDPRQEKWNEDIDYLYEQLSSRQPDFEKITDKEIFKSELDSVKENVARSKDIDIILELQSIIAKFHIAHTQIALGLRLNIPLDLELFDDGLFIVGIDSAKSKYLKCKIVGINSMGIDSVFNKVAKICSYENEYWLKQYLPILVVFPEILNHYGIIENRESITFNLENDENLTLYTSIQNIKFEVVDAFLNCRWLKDRNKYYWFDLIDKNTIYIQYNKCSNDPNYRFNQFVTDIDSIFNNKH